MKSRPQKAEIYDGETNLDERGDGKGDFWGDVMPAKIPEFCRNVEEIAGVIGVKVPSRKRWQMYAAFTKKLKGWTENRDLPRGCPPFPVKSAKGWVRKEVAAWGEAKANAETLKSEILKSAKGKGQTGLTRLTGLKGRENHVHHVHPVSTSELPPRDDAPGPEDELFESPAKQYERRLDHLQDKFLNPQDYPQSKIAQFEIEELRKNRPHIFPGTPEADGADDYSGEIPMFVKNATALAGWLTAYFRRQGYNFTVNKMKISRWTVGKSLGSPSAKPMPGSEPNGTFRLLPAIEWFTKWQLPKHKKGVTPDIFPESENLDQMEDEERRAEIRFNQWEREQSMRADDRNYIRVDEMLGFAAEVGRVVFGVPYRCERDLLKLGVSPEAAATFMGKLCAEMERSLGELSARAKAD